MAAIKELSEISDKFITVTPGRTQQFADGVAKPKKDWQKSTEAAEANFEAGIAKAVQRKAFGKGVKAAGTAKWQKGVAEKGVARWGPGISLSQEAFEKGYGPYREVIARVNLPARFPRRDARNLLRVAAITKPLGDEKEKRG